MIQIHINPSRVEKVLFVSTSDIEEDFDGAAWQAIRPLVNQIDRRLKKIVREILSESDIPPDSNLKGFRAARK